MCPTHSETVARILVTVDGSRPSDVAATMAVEIARAQSYMVDSVYVVDETIVLDPYASYQAEAHTSDELSSREEILSALEIHGNRALAKMAALCEELQVPHSEEILFGNVVDLIGERAGGRLLLAFGRRGNRHAHDHATLGQHVHGILHHVHTSLLIGGNRIAPLDDVLVAYNGSAFAHHALLWAYALQRAMNVRVHIFTVTEQDAEGQGAGLGQQALAHIALPDREHYSVHVASGHPGTAIVEEAERLEVGLILLGRHPKHSLADWWRGSTLEYVLRHSERTVLVA